MVELSLRWRPWSVLQVVAIIGVCYRGKALSERAQGCVGSQLSLRCPHTKIIQITAIVLGDSGCYGASCCIKDDDCTQNANANHTMYARRRCDGKRNCTVKVIQEKIYCGWVAWSNSDFERITYNCIEDPRRSTAATFSRPDSTEDILRTEVNPRRNETEKESFFTESSTDVQNTESFKQIAIDHVENGSPEYQSDNPWVLPVVMTTVCLLIIIAIVFVVFIMRRKRRPKGSAAVEMTENDSNLRSETIDGNENQTMILNRGNGSPSYSSDRTINSNNKDTNISENYEVPTNCVADYAGSTSTDNPIIYCDVDFSEPAYQIPRPNSDVYSVVRDVGEPKCAGSTADASIVDSSVYCNVDIMEPAKATNSSAQNAHSRKEGEYEAVRPNETIPQDSPKKETSSHAHKRTPVSYTQVNKPSKNAVASEPSDNVASKVKVGTSDGYPNPIYEEMSPLIPESTYANAPVLSPKSSVASRSIPTKATTTENPYCEMKSPPVKSTDNGN